MMGSTIERARGRWSEILPALGVDRRYLVNRHGPCPVCGGKDRFRFDDRDGSGSFFCNACGPGPGLMLIRRLHGLDHRTACEEVDRVLGDLKPGRRSSTTARPDSPERRRQVIERTLDEARAPDVVADYLRSRGLSVVPDVLRGHRRLAYLEDGRLVDRIPAMVAPVTGADGSLQSVHRTYLADVPTRKKLLPPVSTVKGATVRLFEPTEQLGIAEGIETAIAAHEIFGLPVWAALTADNLAAFEPPEGARRFVVFGDADASFTGQAAAFGIARRLLQKRRDLAVEVEIPDRIGTDWLDVLTGDA